MQKETKNKYKTKRDIFLATLGTSLVLSLAGGCSATDSNSIYIGNRNPSKITYEDETLSGTFSYENLEKGYLKIVTLEYKGEILTPKLMFTYLDEFRPMRASWSDTIKYIDVENGLTQIKYYYPTCYGEDKECEIIAGEDFTIVEEITLFDYIIEYGWLQEEYDINELITFYNVQVREKIENKDTISKILTPKICENISLT